MRPLLGGCNRSVSCSGSSRRLWDLLCKPGERVIILKIWGGFNFKFWLPTIFLPPAIPKPHPFRLSRRRSWLSQLTSSSLKSSSRSEDLCVWLCPNTLSIRVSLDPTNPRLTDGQRDDLLFNIQLLRDAIILFTASASARGVSGHTGGAYDTVPEVVILLSLFENSDQYVKIFFDEAGATSLGSLRDALNVLMLI